MAVSKLPKFVQDALKKASCLNIQGEKTIFLDKESLGDALADAVKALREDGVNVVF